MDSGTPSASENVRLAELEAEARYARERYQLYRAKAHGPRSTSAGRLGELERQSKLAKSRLDRAKAEDGRSGSLLSATAGLGNEHAATRPG
jgi:hypothetical protein